MNNSEIIRIDGSRGSYEIRPVLNLGFLVYFRPCGLVAWELWVGKRFDKLAAARQAIRRFDAK